MLCERLKIALEQAGLSQVDLARACHVAAPSVHGWLHSKSRCLRGENLLAAARALGVNAEWLASGRGPMHPVTFEADRLHEQSGPHCKGPSGVIDLQQALDIVRQALLACDVAGSKALAGAFASFVDEPDKLVFQSHLMSLLETKAGAMEKHWDKAV